MRRDGLGSDCGLRAGRGTLASNGRPDGDLRLMYRNRSACHGQPQQGELASWLFGPHSRRSGCPILALQEQSFWPWIQRMSVWTELCMQTRREDGRWTADAVECCAVARCAVALACCRCRCCRGEGGWAAWPTLYSTVCEVTHLHSRWWTAVQRMNPVRGPATTTSSQPPVWSLEAGAGEARLKLSGRLGGRLSGRSVGCLGALVG